MHRSNKQAVLSCILLKFNLENSNFFLMCLMLTHISIDGSFERNVFVTNISEWYSQNSRPIFKPSVSKFRRNYHHEFNLNLNFVIILERSKFVAEN